METPFAFGQGLNFPHEAPSIFLMDSAVPSPLTNRMDTSAAPVSSSPDWKNLLGGRFWRIWLLLLLLPMGLIWCNLRGLWRPDEPREAGISRQMATPGASRCVPYLGEDPFCEKPPGYYWLTATGLRLWGTTPGALRMANLLMLLAGALLVGELSATMVRTGGERGLAGFLGGAFMGTAQLSFTVGFWAITDSLLLFASAGALLGLYRGLRAETWRSRLGWYSLMHLFLVFGFYAKNLVAWMVPVLALCGYVVLTRRWRTLLRWELYAGLLLQVALILPWLLAVAARPDAKQVLTIFFHDNLLGRFLPTQGTYVTYSSHRGPPWEYVLELFYYLLPWSPLLWPVAVQAWQRRAEQRWGFLIAAIVLPTLLLSAAACKRSIYYAPVMVAWSVAMAQALLADPHAPATRRASRLAGRICLGAALLVPIISILVLLAIDLPTHNLRWGLLGLGAGLPLLFWLGRQKPSKEADARQWILYGVAALALAYGPLSMGVVTTISGVSDLGPACRRFASEPEPLALFRPDEIILGAMAFHTGRVLPALPDEKALAIRLEEEASLRVMVESTQRRNKDWRADRLRDHFGAEEIWQVSSPGLRPGWIRTLSSISLPMARHFSQPLGRDYSLFRFPPNAGDMEGIHLENENTR